MAPWTRKGPTRLPFQAQAGCGRGFSLRQSALEREGGKA